MPRPPPNLEGRPPCRPPNLEGRPPCRPPRRRPAFLTILAAALLAGCRTPPGPGSVLLDVPFVAQDENECGIAALRMVMAFHGRPVARDALAAEVYLPALKGTTPDVLAEAARRRGMAARVVAGSPAELVAWLEAQQPCILFLQARPDAPRGHFAVATGVDPARRRIRLHTGATADRWLPMREIERQWLNGRFTAVRIAPPPIDNPQKSANKTID